VATTFGTDMVLIRDLAGGGPRDGWLDALAAQLVLTLIATGLIWAFAGAIPRQPPIVAPTLRILSLSLWPAAIWNVASAILRGTGRIGGLALLATAAASVQLAACWFVVAGPGDLELAAASLVAAQCVAAGMALAAAARWTDVLSASAPIGGRSVVSMLRASASVGALGIVGVLYQRVAVLGVGLLAGQTTTAWFASGARIVEGAKAGHVALYGALYPAMAEANARVPGSAAGAAPLRQSLRLSMAAGAIVTAVLLVAGPLAMGILFGPAFEPASAGLAILALSVLPSTLATYLSLEAVANHREGLALGSLVLSLVTLVVLVAGLVPALGWIGACWAVVVAESVQAIGLASARWRAIRADDNGARGRAASEPILAESAR